MHTRERYFTPPLSLFFPRDERAWIGLRPNPDGSGYHLLWAEDNPNVRDFDVAVANATMRRRDMETLPPSSDLLCGNTQNHMHRGLIMRSLVFSLLLAWKADEQPIALIWPHCMVQLPPSHIASIVSDCTGIRIWHALNWPRLQH